MSIQFTASVETSTMINSSMSEKIRENVHLIERNLGTESMLLKQLASCESSYGNLNERLATVEPTLDTLNTSVRSLTAVESSLLGDLSGFCEKLAEAQIPSAQPGLELELSNKFSENTQLQLQLQAVSSEAETLRQRLGENETQTNTLRQSLAEATAGCKKAENDICRIENERLAMKCEFALTEQKIRQRLDQEKATATDRIKHEYEEKLQTLQKEKNDLENGSEEVLLQLGSVRDSLVSTEID
jgi:chromosome segregation ATPase